MRLKNVARKVIKAMSTGASLEQRRAPHSHYWVLVDQEGNTVHPVRSKLVSKLAGSRLIRHIQRAPLAPRTLYVTAKGYHKVNALGLRNT